MGNSYFQFKQFRIEQSDCAMKVCTDACILGAWFAPKIGNHSTVLDIGSGTGLQMLMLAQRCDAEIHGIEIQLDCYRQLKENISASPWADRLQVFPGDVRRYAFPLAYDFIISNPPFYADDLSPEANSKQLAMHSKELTFDELITALLNNLAPAGSAGILLPFHRAAEFTRLAEARGLYLSEELRIKQTPKHNWFRFIGTFRTSRENFVPVNELVIKSGNHYTPEFSELLADYYLAL